MSKKIGKAMKNIPNSVIQIISELQNETKNDLVEKIRNHCEKHKMKIIENLKTAEKFEKIHLEGKKKVYNEILFIINESNKSK